MSILYLSILWKIILTSAIAKEKERAHIPVIENEGNTAMTYTIWSNGGKFEWIIREGEEIVKRSGLVFNSRAAAKRAMIKELA